MNTNYLFGIFGVIVIVVIGIFLLGRDGTEEAKTLPLSQEKVSLESLPINEESANATSTEEISEPELESELDDGALDSEVEDLSNEEVLEEEVNTGVVVYTDQGFSPKIITVNAGDEVTWTNNSSNRKMWIASSIHPTHNDYTEEADSDCGGSSFDACTGVSAGESWSFVFNKTGSWDYHDHLNPSRTGTIEVE